MEKYDVIVLAAGKSERFQKTSNIASKLLHKIQDKTIIEHSLNVFINDKNCNKIFLIANKKNYSNFKFCKNLSKKITLKYGGSCRQESVYVNLKHINSKHVLIHDGARPFVTDLIVKNVLKNLKKYNAVIPGVSVVDSLALIHKNLIKKRISRENVFALQTPQGFKTKLLQKAYREIIVKNLPLSSFTDDSSIFQAAFSDDEIFLSKGSVDNKKITYLSDLKLNGDI